jgi:A/G-specific adenine glycosylase
VAQTLDRTHVREWYYALMDYGAALKKTGPNANRQSAHYARQSPFAGSHREVRSLILKTLLKGPVPSLNKLAQAIGQSPARTRAALQQLQAEGFVVREGTRFCLAEQV